MEDRRLGREEASRTGGLEEKRIGGQVFGGQEVWRTEDFEHLRARIDDGCADLST